MRCDSAPDGAVLTKQMGSFSVCVFKELHDEPDHASKSASGSDGFAVGRYHPISCQRSTGFASGQFVQYRTGHAVRDTHFLNTMEGHRAKAMGGHTAYWVRTWILLALLWTAVHGADDAVPTPVHAPDVDVPVLSPCSDATQEKLTKFSLFNIAIQRRCQDQSDGVNAFPFDVVPSREQLVRLSASPACLVVSKGVLRMVERECILGDFHMPQRATAETILKLNQDRKDLTGHPIPPEDVLQHQILERAQMNSARDANPIGFSMSQYSPDMQQYETQLTKAYASGGIILLSSDYKILNDLSATEQQVGSEAAAAAVAELVGPSEANNNTIANASSTGSGSHQYAEGSSDNVHEIVLTPKPKSVSHSSFRDESASGSRADPAVVKPPVSSATTRYAASAAALVFVSIVVMLF